MKVMRIAAVSLMLFLITAGRAFGAQITIGPVLEHPGTDTMTVMWETDVPADGAVIITGPTGKKDYGKQPEKAVSHLVTLTGLKPGTVYSYQVMTGDAVLHNASFTTLPADESYVVAFIGDTRNRPEVFGGMLEQIKRERPCFIVILGDMVNDGGDVSQWKKYLFDVGKDTFDHIPLVAIVGNQDRDDDKRVDLYRRFFAPPGSSPSAKLYYSLRIGDDLFIILDNYGIRPYFAFTEGPWLWKTLKEASCDPKIRHTFVLSHVGVTSYVENRMGFLSLKLFTGVMARRNVTALITAHDHFYARGQTYSGLPFFITGGGGAPRHEVNRHNIWAALIGRMAFGKNTYNFLIMNVRNDAVTLTAVDDAGRMVDKAQIHATGTLRRRIVMTGLAH
jgi:hypothetical protein